MQLLAPPPIPLSTTVLQLRVDHWAVAVVCKATFTLTPGLSPLAPEQPPLAEREVRGDGEDCHGLAHPADLVPFKRSPEVLLVGSAVSPRGAPVTSLRVGLGVGSWRKHLDVFGDRYFTPAGELTAPEPFTRMPLCWERAAGGPGTINPVGVPMGRAAVPDAWGRVPVPNIQPRGTQLAGRHVVLAPACFAPLAADWPSRAARLSGRGAARLSRWPDLPLLEGLDAGYFNAAPEDQQIPSLTGEERILLENIDPRHHRITTVLERVRPRAVITWATGARAAADLVPDTLFIDAHRGLVSLVWRGQVIAEERPHAGWILLTLDRGEGAAAAAGATWADRGEEEETTAVTADIAPPDPLSARPSRRQQTLVVSVVPQGQALPFQPAREGDSTPPPAEPPPRAGEGSSSAVLPFRPPASDLPPRPPSAHPVAGVALPPLVPAPPRVPSPLPPPPTPAPPSPPTPLLVPSLSASPPIAPPAIHVPAAAPEAIPKPSSVPAPEPGEWPEQPALLGPLAGGAEAALAPAPPAPAPEPSIGTEEREVPLEICAAIAASIARRPDAAPEILREREIDEATFARRHRQWRGAISEEAKRGRADLRRAYDEAYVAQLERERGPLTAEAHAELVVAAERGTRESALARLDVPREAVMPIERVMLSRSLADDELRARLKAALAAARRG